MSPSWALQAMSLIVEQQQNIFGAFFITAIGIKHLDKNGKMATGMKVEKTKAKCTGREIASWHLLKRTMDLLENRITGRKNVILLLYFVVACHCTAPDGPDQLLNL